MMDEKGVAGCHLGTGLEEDEQLASTQVRLATWTTCIE